MKTMQIPESEVRQRLPSRLGLFICAASFEERCLTIAKQLDPSSVRMCLIAENENHRDLHGDHPQQLQSRFPNSKIVPLDTAQPLKTADSLYSVLMATLQATQSSQKLEILVDITTFTHEALLILFRILRSYFKDHTVKYIYAGAKSYSGEDCPATKWLSQGVGEVRSILGYPGLMLPSRKLHLVILAGFEVERVAELIRRYEPSVISLGLSKSQFQGTEVHAPVSEEKFRFLKAIYKHSDDFIFESYDPVATKDAVLRQVKKYPNYNVVLAALNTKPSTLGAGLAAIANSDIQLCYAQALMYNVKNYSKPGGACYLYQE